MKIRDYSSQDKSKVEALVKGILEKIFEGRIEENHLLKEFHNNNGYVLFLVAEIEKDNGKEIIATCGLKHQSKDKVRLKRLYVGEKYREKGIAQKLLDQCIGFAKGKGYKKLVFSSYPIMKGAQKFLRKNGFRENNGRDPTMMYFEKDLAR